MPLNTLRARRLALVTSNVYALIAVVAAIGGDPVRKHLIGAVPERSGGALLPAPAPLSARLVISLLKAAIRKPAPLSATEAARGDRPQT